MAVGKPVSNQVSELNKGIVNKYGNLRKYAFSTNHDSLKAQKNKRISSIFEGITHKFSTVSCEIDRDSPRGQIKFIENLFILQT